MWRSLRKRLKSIINFDRQNRNPFFRPQNTKSINVFYNDHSSWTIMATANDDVEVHFDKIVAVKVAQEGKEEKMVDLRILIQSIHDKSSTSASGSVWRSAVDDRTQDSSRLFASRKQSTTLQDAPRPATYQSTVKKLMIRFTDEENAFFLLCGLIGRSSMD